MPRVNSNDPFFFKNQSPWKTVKKLFIRSFALKPLVASLASVHYTKQTSGDAFEKFKKPKEVRKMKQMHKKKAST